MTTLRELWDAQADDWARFARTPGHDAAHERFNFPAFLELVPPAGRATLDLGCGEGRVGAELERRGHKVVGIDSSPRMVELALERHEALVADAAAMPFEDGAFDLVVAYMSLMNMDDLDGAVREAGRVLESGARLVAAVGHPIGIAGDFDGDDPESPFVVHRSYLDGDANVFVSNRGGIRVTFVDRVISLERFSRALEYGGFTIERLREPVPGDAYVADHPRIARRRRVPLFLHFVALKE